MCTRIPLPAHLPAAATRCRAISFAALLLALGASGAQAQGVPAQGQAAVQREGQRAIRLEGRVVSAKTGQPLPFARVEVPELDRRTVADAQGRFRLDRIPAGEHAVRAEVIGYQTGQRAVTAAEGAAVEIALAEDPVMLQGLTVTANRFTSRLRAYSYTYRVLDRAAIAQSGASDVRHLIATRGGLLTVPCTAGGGFCIRRRGAVMRPVVYVDDAFRPAGMDELTLMAASEISRVEVLRGGVQIRVYTEQFTEWAARNNYRPTPLIEM